MQNDFDGWNKQKSKINYLELTRQCHAGEVWVVSVGINISVEVDGKSNNFSRPVVVLVRCNKSSFIGAPLTKTKKDSSWYFPCDIDGKDGSINLSQIRLFDQRRLERLVGKLDKSILENLLETIRNIFK